MASDVRSQSDYSWEQTVNWDGITHWSKYMITQPAFQGPNALPVPSIGNGSIDSVNYIGLTGNLHFSPGDNTQNLFLKGNYCLVKKVASIDISWVPIEFFILSDSIIFKRHVYTDYKDLKTATGDVHFSTNIQLLNKWRNKIQLALRLGFRYPSGSGFGAARNVDGPGYYFDLSYGKPFRNKHLKLIGMFGFYVWQIFSINNYGQNDAFLFGTGLEWNKKNIRLQSSVSGYLGWIHKGGDKPIVFRTRFENRFKRTSLLLGFQQGLHDFKYSSFEFGMIYRFFKSPK